jgi:hypothetical protein
MLSGWIDAIWIPIAALAVEGIDRRIKAAAFVIVCMMGLRLQIEILNSTGFGNGITGWLDMSPYHRGVIVYSIIIAANLLLVHFFPATRGVFYISLSLGLFFIGFAASSLFMVL